MKISARIFLGYFFIVGLGVFWLLNTFMAELRPGTRQAMEEMMVDTANLLAELVEREVAAGTIARGDFSAGMADFLAREFDARIWSKHKTGTDLRVYITDTRGIVIYDSAGRDVGADFSQWRDVFLTLRGEYGARSTRANPGDSQSSVMHVAAPVRQGGELLGVLTTAKPNISVQPFIEFSRQKLAWYSAIVIAVSVAIGLFFSLWFTHSIRKLVRYANRVSRGEKAELPRIQESELAELGGAIEKMRRELEGRDYVERYIHTLTHEMKSPLSGIQGAAELLVEPMPEDERRRFLDNVLTETARLQDFIQRMLDLASVEKRQSLQSIERIDVAALCREVRESKLAELARKQLDVRLDVPVGLAVEAEEFLLRQSLATLLDNAIAFSPAGGEIAVLARAGEAGCEIAVCDRGPGIPEFAVEKVFDRFYSLPRPDTGKKSSGLGLSFAREAMALHRGGVRVENLTGGGLRAVLVLPVECIAP